MTGADVAALCGLAGLPVDSWQQQVLDEVFAPDGRAAKPECVLRMEGEGAPTGILVRCALGWLYLADESRILWVTAASQPGSRDRFGALTSAIEASGLLRQRTERSATPTGPR